MIVSEKEITNILTGFNTDDIIFFKTRYLDRIYLTLEDIINLNIIIDKINFCIKTKYLKFIDKNINSNYINKALFIKFASKVKTSLAEPVFCQKFENSTFHELT